MSKVSSMSGRQAGETCGHVFISYVREDGKRVDRLQAILEGAGLSVWRDTASIWPGQDWRLEIRNAIRSGSLAFIACFSENSERREASYQNEELVLAVEQMRVRRPGVPWLIPVRFAECSIPDLDLGAGRMLDSLQHVDLFDGTWEQGVPRILGAVHRILSGAAPTPGPAAHAGAPPLPHAASARRDLPVASTPSYRRAEPEQVPRRELPPPGNVKPGEGDVPRPARRRRTRVVWSAAGIAVLVAIALIAYLIVDTRTPNHASAQGKPAPGVSVSLARAYSGSQYGFSSPDGIAVNGDHVWVANYGNDSVTEINASNGALVKTLSGGSYDFHAPCAMADDGTHVFIGDCLGLDVTEFDANTGNWIRTIWLPDSGTTNGLALAGGHLWVSAFLPDSVFEYDEDDGTLIRTLQGGAYGLDMPGAVAADNEHVWVSNPANNSVTEILASDGGLVRSIPFNEPGGIMSDGRTSGYQAKAKQ